MEEDKGNIKKELNYIDRRRILGTNRLICNLSRLKIILNTISWIDVTLGQLT